MQAQQLQAEQERTSQQVTQELSSQAEEAQKKIQSTTQVTIQTQRDVRGLSTIARKAQMTAQKTDAKMEEQAQARAQNIHEQSAQMEL